MKTVALVGFDQKVLIHQLDFVASKVNQTSTTNMHELLKNYLINDIKGNASRRCAHAIIMKIWWSVDEGHIPVRDYAAIIYPNLTTSEKKFVHWCMTCLAYPFLRKQVNYTGKQFRLADDVTSRTIVAEMKSMYGDRRRIEVATGAVLSTVKNWNILEMSSPGLYHLPERKIEIHESELKFFILEVLFEHLNSNNVTLEYVNNNALFFPFDYHVSIGDLNHPRFTIIKTINDTVIERNPKIPYLIE